MAANPTRLDRLISLIDKLNQIPWATFIVLVIAIVGGIAVLSKNSALNFEDYVKFVGGSAAALGVGRGVASAGKQIGQGGGSRPGGTR